MLSAEGKTETGFENVDAITGFSLQRGKFCICFQNGEIAAISNNTCNPLLYQPKGKRNRLKPL